MNDLGDIFKDTWYGKKALERFGEVPENFMLYEAGWMEHKPPFVTMQVKGGVFREAKRGANKGKLCILVPGSTQVAYVYPDKEEK